MKCWNDDTLREKKVEGYKWTFVQSGGKFVKLCVRECKTTEHRTEIHENLRKLDSQTLLRPLYVLGSYSQMQIFQSVRTNDMGTGVSP